MTIKKNSFNSINEVKNFVDKGYIVYWSNSQYRVRKDAKLNDYYIVYLPNQSIVGLTESHSTEHFFTI